MQVRLGYHTKVKVCFKEFYVGNLSKNWRCIKNCLRKSWKLENIVKGDGYITHMVFKDVLEMFSDKI